MSENKRFYIDNDGDLYDKQTNKLLMLDFGYGEAIYINSVVECLNNLHEENQQLKNDATVLIQSNQEYRKENARMQETLQKKEELLRSVLKVNDNLTKKVRELEEDNLELKEAMKRMMGDLMSR